MLRNALCQQYRTILASSKQFTSSPVGGFCPATGGAGFTNTRPAAALLVLVSPRALVCRHLNSSSASSTRTTNSSSSSASNVIPGTTVSSSKTAARTGFRLPSNIKFNYCGGAVAETASSLPDGELAITGTRRPLMMLFGWMLAKDIHMEKYRQFWYERGFDVLTVFTSPFDLLLPKIGGIRNAKTLCQIVGEEIRPRYQDIMIHTFSVGAYQFCEMWSELQQSDDPKAKQVLESFRGFIQDSTVYNDGCPPGLSRAITTNPIGQPLIEHSLEFYLWITKPWTMDHYNEKYVVFSDNATKLPSLFLYSKDDAAADHEKNHNTYELWKQKGIFVREKCWEKSAHVLHFRGHNDEYRNEVDNFVRALNIDNSNIKLPN